MTKIFAYKLHDQSANIDQLPMKRDWMDITFDRHAYHCFPMSLANRYGWGIFFEKDISFIWDGINDSTSNHVKILKGEEFVHSNRGNRTVSFNTGVYFESDKNISLLTIPVPNQFIDGAQCITTIVSSSVLENDFPIAWMITRPNVEITIPAGTPIACILPISIKETEKYEIFVKNGIPELWNNQEWKKRMSGRAIVSQEKNSKGDWTHFYRDAVDHLGNQAGEHEVKKIILKTHYEKDN